MKKQMSLNKKVFMFISLSTVLLSLIISTVIYVEQQSELMHEKEIQLENMVEVSYNIIEGFHQNFKDGTMTEDEAKLAAKKAIERIRYSPDKKDYFWINNTDNVMVMHPISKNLNGKDLSGVKDTKGLAIFVEFSRVAKEKGSGFVNYFWQYKDQKNRTEEKLSYVKHFQPWGWVIGTGIYINDIQETLNKLLVQLIILVLVIITITIIISHFTVNRDLKNVAHILSDASGVINKAANEISDGNLALSSRVQEQSSSLEETASTMEEVSSNIKQNAENCQIATQHTNQSLSTVKEGEEVSANVQHSMKEINESSKKISDIVSLVEELAFQTNILAINAAIEAAKAGDLGKGFAVVAIEVRDLAQRSSEAAVEIKNLISTSLDKVEEGVGLVDQNTDKFSTILETFQKVNDLMSEINSATSEQSNAVEEINKAVTELDSTNQENASHIDQMAGLSENMATEAKKLNNLVIQYFN